MADHDDDSRMKGSVSRSRCERSHRCRLDLAIKHLVPGAEALIMRPVSRPPIVIDRHDQPRCRAPSHPGACLDVLGHALRLSAYDHETQSRHIEPFRNHVRRKRDVIHLRRIADFESRKFRGYILRRDAARQLEELVAELTRRFLMKAGIEIDAVVNVVVHHDVCAAEFSPGVEIGDERPERIACTGSVGEFRGGLEKRGAHALQRELRTATRGRDAHVCSAWNPLIENAKTGVVPVEDRRRELADGTVEEGSHLRFRTSDCGCTPDDLWPHVASRAEPVDGTLVQCRHRTEWTRDEMKLVLDDQIGGRRAIVAEEPVRFRTQCDLSKLVYGSQKKRWSLAVDILVYRPDRQGLSVKLTTWASALHDELLFTRPSVPTQRLFACACRAPCQLPGFLRAGSTCIGDPVGRRALADPQSNGEWRGTEGSLSVRVQIASQLFACADQPRCTLELLHGQQPQAVAHQNCNSGTRFRIVPP